MDKDFLGLMEQRIRKLMTMNETLLPWDDIQTDSMCQKKKKEDSPTLNTMLMEQ